MLFVFSHRNDQLPPLFHTILRTHPPWRIWPFLKPHIFYLDPCGQGLKPLCSAVSKRCSFVSGFTGYVWTEGLFEWKKNVVSKISGFVWMGTKSIPLGKWLNNWKVAFAGYCFNPPLSPYAVSVILSSGWILKDTYFIRGVGSPEW